MSLICDVIAKNIFIIQLHSLKFYLPRFADILGLELNMIKVFTDEIPRVPISAFTDLDLDPSEYQVKKKSSQL